MKKKVLFTGREFKEAAKRFPRMFVIDALEANRALQQNVSLFLCEGSKDEKRGED